MPIGLCSHCHHTYVLEHAVDRQNHCPTCHEPLRIISPGEDHRLRQEKQPCRLHETCAKALASPRR